MGAHTPHGSILLFFPVHDVQFVDSFATEPVRPVSLLVFLHYARDSVGLNRDEPHSGLLVTLHRLLDRWAKCEGQTRVQASSLLILHLEGC